YRIIQVIEQKVSVVSTNTYDSLQVVLKSYFFSVSIQGRQSSVIVAGKNLSQSCIVAYAVTEVTNCIVILTSLDSKNSKVVVKFASCTCSSTEVFSSFIKVIFTKRDSTKVVHYFRLVSLN